MTGKTLTLVPIGAISTPFLSKYVAPRQPASAPEKRIGVITLDGGQNFEQALQDLKEFDYIWILFWFDRNTNWKPKVLPPNSGRVKRGLFATRSPHRPNPIGLSLCKLIDIRGRRIRIENPDMLDGTPILDIKPYIPHAEAFPDARSGWISKVNERSAPSYRLTFSPEVKRHFKEIGAKESRELRAYITGILTRDPFPHPYRRIKVMQDGTSVIAVRRWRFTFTIKGKNIRVTGAFHNNQ
jgi:tRNA-Thr(GGU) m(6)t(6)A37 methyltransferase TsaA